MMEAKGIHIEYIQNGLPFKESEEFVVIVNQGKSAHDLAGWKLVYEDLQTGELLHTHHFYKLNGTFDPGERLCVISAKGTDRFQVEGGEERFPGAHWDLFTDHPLHLLTSEKVRVRLLGSDGRVVDSLTVERHRNDAATANAISIFIGHGRDPQWRDLKDHLQDHHGFKVIAYEVGPRAGLSVKEVLEKMLSESSFGLLVLTGEDIDSDGEAHARENVVHELGLFQGRLGFTRAIALVESEVKEFSNIFGVNQIRFRKGSIKECFGDVLATIKREFENA